MIAASNREWRVVLLAVVAGGGALLSIGLAAARVAYALLEPRLGSLASPPFATEGETAVLVLVGGMAVAAGVFIAAFVEALQTLRGRSAPAFVSPPMRWWVLLICLGSWLGASGLVQLLPGRDAGRWAIALLHILAIGLPIFVLIRVALGGIQGGSRMRLWGTLTTGMVLGTGLAVIIEIILLVAAGIAAGAYLIANPTQLLALQRLAHQLLQIEAPEESLAVLGPYLANPLVLLLALGVVAVVTPIVEEIAKSAPIWAIYDRLTDGSQGFWAGALSGAGFALFEGILVSSDAGTGIAAILVLRAGSSLMHIMASGFAGWGIAAFRATRSVTRLVAGYGAAMAAHALWNGSVVAIGYGGIRTTYGATQPDVFGVALSIIGAMTLAGLIGGLPIALVAVNLKLRAKPQEPGLSASSPSAGPESTHPLEG